MSDQAIAMGEGLIRETTLGEQLYRYLVDLIDSGKIAVGAKLPTEKQLCERFGISRPVVRDALARLRMEGIIASRRGSGSYVIGPRGRPIPDSLANAPFAPTEHRGSKLTDLLRCFEMRLMIECDAAYYAAQRRQPVHLDQMSAAMIGMESALRMRSLDHRAHFKFHLLIAEATGNHFVVNGLLLLRHHMEVCMNLLRDLWLIEPNEPINTGEYRHVDIYQAIKEQRAEDANLAMYLHLDEARREIFGDLAGPVPKRLLQSA